MRRLQGVIGSILEMAVGGVIRAGKQTYGDTSVGFWLGVDDDGLAKFSIGNNIYFLQWTGTLLELGFGASGIVIGGNGLTLGVPSSYAETSAVTWKYGADRVGDLYATLLDYVPESSVVLIARDVSGYNTLMDVRAENGAGTHSTARLVAKAGYTTAHVRAEVVGMSGFVYITAANIQITGTVSLGGTYRITQIADATDATDALNRQTGDGRYLQQSAGASGSFTTVDGKTVTVVDGQITAIV